MQWSKRIYRCLSPRCVQMARTCVSAGNDWQKDKGRDGHGSLRLTRFNVYNPEMNADNKPELCLWTPTPAAAKAAAASSKDPPGHRRLGHASVKDSNMTCPKGLESRPLPPLLLPILSTSQSQSQQQQQHRQTLAGGSRPSSARMMNQQHPLLPDVRFHPLRHYKILSDPLGRDQRYNSTLFKSMHFTDYVNKVHIHVSSVSSGRKVWQIVSSSLWLTRTANFVNEVLVINNFVSWDLLS